MFWNKDKKIVESAKDSVSLNTNEKGPDGVEELAPAQSIPLQKEAKEKLEQGSFAYSNISNATIRKESNLDGIEPRNIEVKVDSHWQHFKGSIVVVKALAHHSESGELLVIYEHDNELWARPIDSFLSSEDIRKRPDNKTGQKYRFEEIK